MLMRKEKTGVEGVDRTVREASNPPARDIEGLLWWAYQDQAVDRALRGPVSLERPAGYRSAWGAVGWREQLGCAIDCAGSAAMAPAQVDPVAEWVHERVLARGLVAGLVIGHAKAGTRPELAEGPVRLVAALAPGGKPRVVYQDEANQRRPLWCVLQPDPLPEHTAFCRERWRAWWEALDTLAVECGVEGLDAPQEPWGLTARGET